MKALQQCSLGTYAVNKTFNKIIKQNITSYNGSKKEQLKSFLEDLQQEGCSSGMIGKFIYHHDCKKFYIRHLDDLENIKNELENSLGETITNRFQNPHWTFMCWLCFEEYCFDIYHNTFEN